MHHHAAILRPFNALHPEQPSPPHTYWKHWQNGSSRLFPPSLSSQTWDKPLTRLAPHTYNLDLALPALNHYPEHGQGHHVPHRGLSHSADGTRRASLPTLRSHPLTPSMSPRPPRWRRRRVPPAPPAPGGYGAHQAGLPRQGAGESGDHAGGEHGGGGGGSRGRLRLAEAEDCRRRALHTKWRWRLTPLLALRPRPGGGARDRTASCAPGLYVRVYLCIYPQICRICNKNNTNN